MGGDAGDGGAHPLQQMGVDAQPTQSLANVADKIGHAAVLGQRPHQCVQITKEFWKSEQTFKQDHGTMHQFA